MDCVEWFRLATTTMRNDNLRNLRILTASKLHAWDGLKMEVYCTVLLYVLYCTTVRTVVYCTTVHAVVYCSTAVLYVLWCTTTVQTVE
jgi:hypothetical protein